MEEKNFDKFNLRNVILEYPNQLELSKKFTEGAAIKKKEFSNLIICGMGGSAIPADVLSSYLASRKKPFSLPIYIARSYDLPNVASADSLIFISSYSGTTEETLSCFEKALELGSSVVAFSAGGTVETIAKENNVPHIKYDIKFKDFQPRYATTYAFVAMNEVLTKIGLSDTIEQLPTFDSRLLEVEGEDLAKKIKGKTPVIYAPSSFKILAKTWKIKFNENAKTPAFWNYFPELNHNEMVGFTHQAGEFHAVFFNDQSASEQLQKRIAITAKLYEEYGISVSIIEMKGETFLEKLIWGMILGDWASYYLAYEYEQDPTPVEMVEKLKELLK